MLLERGGGGIAPTHSPPNTRKQWVAITTLQLLYHWESLSTRGWVSLGA
jgi:hypothetical protein